MASHPTVELLARVPLFQGLSRANLARIASVAEEAAYNAGREEPDLGLKILEGISRRMRRIVSSPSV